MVRKQTWILLIVFGLLLGAAFYLQKNPLPAGNVSTPTTSPTTSALMLPGWQAGDIVSIEYQDQLSGTAVRVVRDAQGSWMAGPDGTQPVEAGLVEEVRAELTSARVQTVLDPGYALDALGLSAATETVRVKNQQGQQSEIQIGQKTPTGSGYYIRVDGQAPIVVTAGAVEGFLSKIKNELVTAPAPAATEMQPNAAP